MAKVTKIRPNQSCYSCGGKMRPVTQQEIEAGLADPNATVRQVFAHAVQGDIEKRFVVANSFTAAFEDETATGSWVLRCDACGATGAYVREEAPE